MPPARAVLAAGAAVVCVGVVAGCGGSGGSASAKVRPAQAVALAASTARHAGSAHVVGTIRLRMPRLAGGGVSAPGGRTAPMNLSVTADEQWSPRLRMRMTIGGLDVPGVTRGRVEERIIGTRLYAHVPGLGSRLGEPWIGMDLRRVAGKAGLDLGQLFDQAGQLNPTNRLALLQRAGDLREVGVGQLDGVRVTHYAGTVDVSSALRHYPTPASKGELDALRRTGVKTEHVDVWVDGASRIRREKATAAGSRFSMASDLRISRYGERVAVEQPPVSQTLDLSSLLGSGRLGASA